MADSLGTLYIASAGGGSATVTLVASGTRTVTEWGTVSVTLTSAIFVMCRPITRLSESTSAGTLCVIAGGQATAYYTSSSYIFRATASLNSSGTTLTLGSFYMGSNNAYSTVWEYNAFG